MKRRRRNGGRQPATPGPADALFAKVQQRVLGVLFGNPARSFYANEMIGLARSGTGAVQRELARLEAAALVTAIRVGKQKHYQANRASPVFQELRALVLKTSGLGDVLREAMAPLSSRIRAAFVYGSIAKGEDTATSDIDLMVIGEGMSYADLFGALEEASARLGRKVAPTIYP
jgi:predicted nucleotidyltransferase